MTEAGQPEYPDLLAPGPVFFLSYARSQLWAERLESPVGRLYGLLSAHVHELVGSPTGVKPGFMDETLEGGTRWEAELLTEVGTCQVFVPLISRPYLRSDWCAREWHAFARRKAITGGRQTAIIPVIWAPFDFDSLPPVIKKIQFFTPSGESRDNIGRYHRHGIYGLLAMNDNDTFDTVAWMLALLIAKAAEGCRIEPEIVRDLRELPTTFEGDGG